MNVIEPANIPARVERMLADEIEQLFNPQERAKAELSIELGECAAATRRLYADRDQIRQDANLSDQGKTAALQAAAERARKTTEPLAARLREIDRQVAATVARAEVEWAGPTKRERGIESYMAEREIRDRLYQNGTALDPIALVTPYLNAIQSKNTLVVDALEKGPLGPLVNRATLDSGRELKIDSAGLRDSLDHNARLRAAISDIAGAVTHVADSVAAGRDPNSVTHGATAAHSVNSRGSSRPAIDGSNNR